MFTSLKLGDRLIEEKGAQFPPKTSEISFRLQLKWKGVPKNVHTRRARRPNCTIQNRSIYVNNKSSRSNCSVKVVPATHGLHDSYIDR